MLGRGHRTIAGTGGVGPLDLAVIDEKHLVTALADVEQGTLLGTFAGKAGGRGILATSGANREFFWAQDGDVGCVEAGQLRTAQGEKRTCVGFFSPRAVFLKGVGADSTADAFKD